MKVKKEWDGVPIIFDSDKYEVIFNNIKDYNTVKKSLDIINYVVRDADGISKIIKNVIYEYYFLNKIGDDEYIIYIKKDNSDSCCIGYARGFNLKIDIKIYKIVIK